MRKKISIALAAWFVMGSVFAAPVAAPVVEAASESVKLKSTAETYASQGEKLLNEGKYEEAGEAFRKAAEETNNDELWAMCGLSYIKAENYKKALDPCKKAVKLKPNEGLYNFYYGFSLWCYAGVVRAGKPLSSFSGTDEMDKGDQYVKRAAELLPNDVIVQMTAGTIAEGYGNFLAKTGGYRSYIDKEYQRAYQHFRRAVEIDPSKTENVERLNRFVNTHSEYGFQPYGSTPQSANPSTGAVENRLASPLNTPESLKTDSTEMQEMIRTGKIKVYNAGAGFEWWDEEAKADFEALPFSDNIEEVASHVYRVTWDNNNPNIPISYVVLVPRHVRIHYGPDEEDAHDSLLIVEIASKYYNEKGEICLTPATMMNDRYYLRKGRTKEIVHLGGDEAFNWKWLEEGQKEIEEQQGDAILLLGKELFYTFEESGNPNVIILRCRTDDEICWSGKMEIVPSVVTPPVQG